MKAANLNLGALVLVVSILLTGCGGEDKKGVKSDGSCDAGYISALNAIASNGKEIMQYFDSNGQPNSSYSDEAVMRILKRMVSNCNNFDANYKGTSCTAVLESTGQAGQTDVATLERACAAARSVTGKTARVASNETEQPATLQDFANMEAVFPLESDSSQTLEQ